MIALFLSIGLILVAICATAAHNDPSNSADYIVLIFMISAMMGIIGLGSSIMDLQDYLAKRKKMHQGRVRGSHHILKHPDGSMLVLPVHRGTLKVGIILDAIERAGISVEEFEELL